MACDSYWEIHLSVACFSGHYDCGFKRWRGATFANWVFVGEVGKRSISSGVEVAFVIDRLGKAVYITRFQVPPRPPKKTAARLSLFLPAEPWRNKRNPLISNENGDQGVFCSISAHSLLFVTFAPYSRRYRRRCVVFCRKSAPNSLFSQGFFLQFRLGYYTLLGLCWKPSVVVLSWAY